MGTEVLVCKVKIWWDLEHLQQGKEGGDRVLRDLSLSPVAS